MPPKKFENAKPLEAGQSDGNLLVVLGTDGAAWAKEFGTSFSDRVIAFEAPDEDASKVNGGLLIAWFANAIMAGYDSRQPDIDGLAAQLSQAEADKAAAEEQASNARAELAAIDEKLQDANTALGSVTGERDEARSALVSATAKISLLEENASLETVAQPAKLRSVRPLPADDDTDRRRAIIERAIAGEVEIVFSDGKTEIRGLDPIQVTGSSLWATRPQGRMLDKPIDLNGPDKGTGGYRIAGFGLFDDEGDQIGWSQLPEPIVVGAQTRTQLRQCIIF